MTNIFEPKEYKRSYISYMAQCTFDYYQKCYKNLWF